LVPLAVCGAAQKQRRRSSLWTGETDGATIEVPVPLDAAGETNSSGVVWLAPITAQELLRQSADADSVAVKVEPSVPSQIRRNK
jgi:hypothetical protein